MKLPLPKQYNLGNLPGRVLYLYGSAAGVIGMVSGLLSSGTFFMVVIAHFFPVFQIWQWYLVVAISYPVIMILCWMFLVPSSVAVGNEQGYRHDNPAMDKLISIEKRLEIIESRLSSYTNNDNQRQGDDEKINRFLERSPP